MNKIWNRNFSFLNLDVRLHVQKPHNKSLYLFENNNVSLKCFGIHGITSMLETYYVAIYLFIYFKPTFHIQGGSRDIRITFSSFFHHSRKVITRLRWIKKLSYPTIKRLWNKTTSVFQKYEFYFLNSHMRLQLQWDYKKLNYRVTPSSHINSRKDPFHHQ